MSIRESIRKRFLGSSFRQVNDLEKQFVDRLDFHITDKIVELYLNDDFVGTISPISTIATPYYEFKPIQISDFSCTQSFMQIIFTEPIRVNSLGETLYIRSS